MTEPRDQRVPIMLTATELRILDDWRRHQTDLPSRSEAIRRLIEAGLKAASAKKAT
jgi:metal-responsive CopG/Arc/MetJ family transcriptional regulator